MAPGRKGKGRKKSSKVRVDFRRNRNAPARDKDWTRRALLEDTDALDAASSESVVAKGDLSRKRTVIEGKHEADADLESGVVIAMRGLIADVDDGERVWPCTVRRILRTRRIDDRNAVTVGDRVRFRIIADGEGVLKEGVIEDVEPRGGTLARMAGKRRHTFVANVDQAVIIASAGAPPFKSHLVDRYIVAAHAGGIEPVVCLNKIDLDIDGEARSRLARYAALGYRTQMTCALRGSGVAELRAALAGKCSVFAGQSGVGKSSLLNAIDASLKLRTGAVNEDLRKGRHVTTTAVLIKLQGGGYVVDTPGVRSFDLSAVPLNEIELQFVEFRPHIPHCKFQNCTHTHEIGCAVKNAVQRGEISAERYESYCRMFDERQDQTLA